MEEETKDVTVDTNTEVEEATNSDENSGENTGENSVELQEKLELAEKAKVQILARAKKAEEELKKLKAESQNNNNNPQLSDELKLIARGLSDEEIEQAKIIAKGKGVSLNEAIKDNLFTVFQNNLKEQKRKEDAKLGASKGSGEFEEELKGTESGSTRDEHKKAFDKLVGKK